VSAPEDVAATSPPLLRIVRGEPDPIELAALVAVISAAQGTDEEAEPQPAAPSQWAQPERLLRQPVQATGWWASALPR
jgi:hypothetical protein